MRAILVATITLLLVTGCATGVGAPDPSSSPTGAPSSTPTAEPAISELRLGASKVTALDSTGSQLAAVAFDAPVADMVALFEDAFEEPASLQSFAQSECTDATGLNEYSWADFGITITEEDMPSSLASWREVSSYRVGVAVEEYRGVALSASSGVAVNSDGTAVLASVPADRVEQVSETGFWVLLDVGGEYNGPTGAGQWGSAAIVDAGGVTSLSAPTWVNDARC